MRKEIGRAAFMATWNIPKHELEALAKCFLPDILAFYETEEGKREFEKWKKKQAEKHNAR